MGLQEGVRHPLWGGSCGSLWMQRTYLYEDLLSVVKDIEVYRDKRTPCENDIWQSHKFEDGGIVVLNMDMRFLFVVGGIR
jgi:hypothetical protein